MPPVLEHDWYPDPVPAGVTLGPRSWLYSSFAFIHCVSERPHPVRIGSDSGVYYTSFFDLGPAGEVEIGDFCSVVGAVFATNHRVEVHDYAFLAHDVTIADDPWTRPPRAPRSRAARQVEEHPPESAGSTIVIGNNAWVGARAVLLSGAVIGENAIVGAGAVVDGVVPPDSVAAGNPWRVVSRHAPDQAGRGTRPTT